MRFMSAVIAIGIALAMPSAAKAQSWDEYRPKGIGFRVELPAKPKLETGKTKGGSTTYSAVATFRDMAFMVNYGAKDEKSPGDLNTLLDTVVKAMTEDKKVLSSKKEMIGIYPARPS